MQDNSLAQHWDQIFEKTPTEQLGWFEQNQQQTLSLLTQVSLNKESTVFIPGAGATTLIETLLPTQCQLILNDISATALNQLKLRIGHTSERVEYLLQSVAEPLKNIPKIDLWIDRAVLHFLLKENEIQQYFINIKQRVSSGGYVALAQFSTQGATKCAGLPIKQYSLNEMQQRLGKHFKTITHQEYTFVNPAGAERPYIYALFKHVN